MQVSPQNDSTEQFNNAEIANLALAELTPNPLNPRGPVGADDAGMEGLVESVREKGVLQPLIVTSDGTIVIGHRRHKAAELAGLSTVPCILRDYDSIAQQEIMLIENVQREDLNPLQEGQAYARLLEAGVIQSEIARKIGFPEVRIYQRLIITRFPADIAALFGSLDLPVSAAAPLSMIEDEDALRRITGLVVSRRLAVAQVEKLVKEQQIKTRPRRRSGGYDSESRKQRARPQGIVLDEMIEALNGRAAESVTIHQLLGELDYVCCACGMSSTPALKATLCSACPLAAFLNRFAKIPIPPGTHRQDLMAKTATEAGQ